MCSGLCQVGAQAARQIPFVASDVKARPPAGGRTVVDGSCTILQVAFSDGRPPVDSLSTLARLLDQHAMTEGANPSRVGGLTLFRHSGPTPPCEFVYEPSICLIAQGAKRVELGETDYRYEAGMYLLVSADLPAKASIVGATARAPYLALTLLLDPLEVGEFVCAAGPPGTPSSRARARRELARPGAARLGHSAGAAAGTPAGLDGARAAGAQGDHLPTARGPPGRPPQADGLDSPSQFSREYRRLFGAPPRKDVEGIRQGQGQEAAARGLGRGEST